MDSPEPQNERIARLEERDVSMEARLSKGDEKFNAIQVRVTELEKQVTYLKGAVAVVTFVLPIIVRMFQ